MVTLIHVRTIRKMVTMFFIHEEMVEQFSVFFTTFTEPHMSILLYLLFADIHNKRSVTMYNIKCSDMVRSNVPHEIHKIAIAIRYTQF